jgi:hypothetical protein
MIAHGAHSAEALALKREIQALARVARETLALNLLNVSVH